MEQQLTFNKVLNLLINSNLSIETLFKLQKKVACEFDQLASSVVGSAGQVLPANYHRHPPSASSASGGGGREKLQAFIEKGRTAKKIGPVPHICWPPHSHLGKMI